MVYTLGLICWLEKVLFWKSELYTSKYTLNPLLCQNMVNFTPMPKLGTHQDLEEPVFNALKTVRISVVNFQCEGFSSIFNQLEMLLFSTQTSRRRKKFFLFFHLKILMSQWKIQMLKSLSISLTKCLDTLSVTQKTLTFGSWTRVEKIIERTI